MRPRRLTSPKNWLHQLPEPGPQFIMQNKILVIACGAIARELVRIKKLNQWDHLEFQCLPQLKSVYFNNYKRIVYLAQSESEELKAMAQNQNKSNRLTR
jgi:hypothetical protein